MRVGAPFVLACVLAASAFGADPPESLPFLEREMPEAEAHPPVRVLWARYLPFLERRMQEAEAAKDEPAVARLTGAIGLAQYHLGEYRAALALFQRQLALFQRLGDPRGRGQAQSNVGIALVALARFAEAIEAFERSRELMEAAGDAAGVAHAFNNLGSCQRYLGNYAAALMVLGRSLQLKEEAGNRAELPSTLGLIGEVYRLQGAPLQALEYFRRSHSIAAELGQKMATGVALQAEGTTLLELERPEEARAVLERSLNIQASFDDDPASAREALAESHRSLATRDPSHRARALELLEHSRETAERTQAIPVLVRTLWQIAALRLQEDRTADALEGAERAAETARRYELREELWPALLVAGRAHQAVGHPDRAEAALREAVDVIEALRTQTVGPEADRAAFLVRRAAPYQELVALLAEGGRPWEALAVAERSRGRVLLDVLAGGRSAIGTARSESERADERGLEAGLLAANSEIRALLLRPERDADRMKQLEAERAERRLALEDFRAREYAAHPELRVLRGEARPLTPDDARLLLAGGHTVLLEYALTERRAYVFVLALGPSGEPSLAVHRLDLESRELVRRARDLRERLASRDLEFAPPSGRLYQTLLAPARDTLRRCRRVVVVPDGALWELPFQALRPPDGRFLIEELAVSYAPSLSVLRDMRAHRRAAAHPGVVLLAMGDPGRGPGEPLPDAEANVREIARLYDPGTAVVRVGAEAREPWLKAEAARFRILHLATHGVLDDASPLYSALVLATPRAGEHDDGLLEAREILDLDLPADLAVLSACETGRGRAGAGEGLIGMTWAFFVAGCPTTVASQWKVEAASTSHLMLAFHRELRGGRAPAEALRLAALAQLRKGDQRHPFYWAGFVAMGDAYSTVALPPRADRAHR